MAIRLGQAEVGSDYYLVMSAQHVNINLFRGAWRDDGEHKAHAYIYDEQMTALQTSVANFAGGHIATLRSGQSKRFSATDVQALMDGKSVARLIFEGIAPNDEICSSQPEDCYISVALYRYDEASPVVERKVYMDLRDIKDYYQHITAGSAEQGKTGSFNAVYDGPDALHEVHPEKVNIYQGVVPDSKINEHYTMLVHGWRMRDVEKTGFAETAFKRLYWSGYMGQFGTFSWPTGWFDKPAHNYNKALILLDILPNIFNYNRSESVARRVGVDLATWLEEQSGLLGGIDAQRHIIAHSMGNVVVSEMLRNSQVQMFDSYAPSEAATVAGAYDSSVGYYQHKMVFTTSLADENCESGELILPENSWRCYSVEESKGSKYDMPPDMYRSDFIERDEQGLAQLDGDNKLVIRHGQTDDATMLAYDSSPYYENIQSMLKQHRIINFHNADDAALSGWELNQLTKPDTGAVFEWKYSNVMTEAWDEYNACIAQVSVVGYGDCGSKPVPVNSVVSHFYSNASLLEHEIFWSEQTTPDSAEILARIIPARTKALGQNEQIFSGNYLDYTSSNQDHSAQFHGYYAEPSVKIGGKPVRARYWNWILTQPIGLLPSELSGLKNGLGIGAVP